MQQIARPNWSLLRYSFQPLVFFWVEWGRYCVGYVEYVGDVLWNQEVQKKKDQTACLFGPWQETCGVWSKRSIFQGCCPPENFEWVFMMVLPPFPLVPPFHLPVTGYLFLPILFHRSPTLRCSPLVPNGPLHAAAKHHVQSGNDPINPRFQPKAPKQRSNPPTGLNKTGSRRRIPWNAGCLMGFWCYGLWNNLRITVVGHPLYTTNKATIGFFSLLNSKHGNFGGQTGYAMLSGWCFMFSDLFLTKTGMYLKNPQKYEKLPCSSIHSWKRLKTCLKINSFKQKNPSRSSQVLHHRPRTVKRKSR